MSQADLARLLTIDAGQVSRWCNDKAPLRGTYAAQVITLLRDRGAIIDGVPTGTRVFLSTPMAAYADPRTYETARSAAASLFEQLTQVAPPVYWAAAHIDSTARFEAPDLATERNLAALIDASAFVYLQIAALTQPTSCHVELGMAIALRIPVTVFAPDEKCLPYGLHNFEAVAERIGIGGRFRFYAIKDVSDAVRLLTIHGADLLGLPHPRQIIRAREASV